MHPDWLIYHLRILRQALNGSLTPTLSHEERCLLGEGFVSALLADLEMEGVVDRERFAVKVADAIVGLN